MAYENSQSQASTNYKEAFALFDKRGTGRVPLESLGDLLRACGQNPTLAEIRDLEKNVGGDCECPYRMKLCSVWVEGLRHVSGEGWAHCSVKRKTAEHCGMDKHSFLKRAYG